MNKETYLRVSAAVRKLLNVRDDKMQLHIIGPDDSEEVTAVELSYTAPIVPLNLRLALNHAVGSMNVWWVPTIGGKFVERWTTTIDFAAFPKELQREAKTKSQPVPLPKETSASCKEEDDTHKSGSRLRTKTASNRSKKAAAT